VTLIAVSSMSCLYSLIVHPEIKRPEDLRGKKLAISRYGSNSDYATRKILIKWGLSPIRMSLLSRYPAVNPRDWLLGQNGQVAGLVAQPAGNGTCAQGASQQSRGAIGLWQRLHEHTHRCYRCLHQRPKGYRPSVHPSFG
jgi:ABC-type taurine transport system substrate-binding protein